MEGSHFSCRPSTKFLFSCWWTGMMKRRTPPHPHPHHSITEHNPNQVPQTDKCFVLFVHVLLGFYLFLPANIVDVDGGRNSLLKNPVASYSWRCGRKKGQQYKDLGLKVEKNPLEMSFRMTKKNCKMSEQIKWTISGNKLREQNELYFNFLLTIFWKQNLIEDDISFEGWSWRYSSEYGGVGKFTRVIEFLYL